MKSQQINQIYENSGCEILFVSAVQKKGIRELEEVLRGKTTAVAGPSGVGKSSLVNCLQEGTQMQTYRTLLILPFSKAVLTPHTGSRMWAHGINLHPAS